MFLLKEDITRKKRVNKLFFELKVKAGDDKKYQIGTIYNSEVYTNKVKRGQLLRLYY